MPTSAPTGSTPGTTYVSMGQLKPLKFKLEVASSGGCNTQGGEGQASCGSSDGPQDMPAAIWDKVKDHPCYSEEAHHHFARMHVAVAPACNIQCNYCNRKYDCSNESRPGVVSQKLTPEQAVRKVVAVASAIPQMTVLGIAGPGDALANPAKTFDTFRMLQAQAPDIKLCISTNGLALPDLVDEICKYNVDHVTITINMVDPVIGAKIYPWIFWNHRRVTGIEAATILHQRQMLGLEMLTARGVLTKINSVLIPGINDQHLMDVNREVKKRGAFLHNIMPLISEPEHGTVFGLTGQRGPSAAELKAVQDACMGGANLMRHCRQCRADAVGLLGEDRSEEFTLDKLDQMQDVVYDLNKRQAYQAKVALERTAQQAAKQQALASAAALKSAQNLKVMVAVATKGGGRVNEHFGHVTEFQVFEVSATQAKFVGHRRVDQYCQGGAGDDEPLPSVVRAINDCHAVLVAKIGACPRDELMQAGVEPVDAYVGEFIEKAALGWFNDYRARVASGAVVHQARGDAQIRQGAYTTLAA
ncbi:nitrogen fixation protein NifB [Rhodoferax antarcticus]|uniref:FeMo cofactor biosynthesis protein NifB n=2 Tax=Rhodoferax antarcticus TaxID=81479 RepID=A0A1Q8YFX0_9BURK|nr:nitrogenase cofactor biosynthesis protein NifB [Rhodoferax antarcticus]APW45445.1 nitrogenase cofactor biosynthesis protein NifB [Rhodoferax antarcticus]MCW2312693.1 nitrogen fixation protein NifB [Rhodoferax antarcticus]OLP06882.1 nitrogenase cofactor biosynthesis protein NifB [Rhodoferax antarcticus ANT.BR]